MVRQKQSQRRVRNVAPGSSNFSDQGNLIFPTGGHCLPTLRNMNSKGTATQVFSAGLSAGLYLRLAGGNLHCLAASTAA